MAWLRLVNPRSDHCKTAEFDFELFIGALEGKKRGLTVLPPAASLSYWAFFFFSDWPTVPRLLPPLR
jgi:hypothetical protein